MSKSAHRPSPIEGLRAAGNGPVTKMTKNLDTSSVGDPRNPPEPVILGLLASN